MIFMPESCDRGGSGWREYQSRTRRGRRTGRRPGKCLRRARALCVLTAFVAGGYFLIAGSVGSHPYSDQEQGQAQKAGQNATPPRKIRSFDKSDLQQMVDHRSLPRLDTPWFDIYYDSRRLTIKTTIETGLQAYLESKLDRRHSRYIGIVAMDPQTGRILALVGFNKIDPSSNPCLDSRHPAASIFKIITASAAVEEGGLDSDSTLTFNGRKHTLYKSQLKDRNNKYTRRISLKDSFAQSVNPVFGKLGALRLGKQTLISYAEAFGFNRKIDFEIPLMPSRIEIEDKPYHWAEVASGFNRQTTISPVHGALIAAAIVNQGRLYEPSIIECVTDENGRERYHSRPRMIHQAIDPATTAIIKELMETTVRSGTARRQFRRAGRDKVLSELTFGGKTGSINDRTNTARYDWFVGYAAQKDGNRQLAVGVMVAHEEYIGTRATEYARMAFRKYFEDLARRRMVAQGEVVRSR